MRIENTQEHDKNVAYRVPSDRDGIPDTIETVTIPAARKGDKGLVNGSLELTAKQEAAIQKQRQSDAVVGSWFEAGHLVVTGASARAAKAREEAPADPGKDPSNGKDGAKK